MIALMSEYAYLGRFRISPTVSKLAGTKDRRDGTSADFLLEWRGKPSGRFSSRQATISHSDPSAGTSAEGLGRRTRGSTGTVRSQLDELGAEQADRHTNSGRGCGQRHPGSHRGRRRPSDSDCQVQGVEHSRRPRALSLGAGSDHLEVTRRRRSRREG